MNQAKISSSSAKTSLSLMSLDISALGQELSTETQSVICGGFLGQIVDHTVTAASRERASTSFGQLLDHDVTES
ncbi:MAG: hypothetical protein AAF151_25720 [Cyanobacteria bacterium J06656_5]